MSIAGADQGAWERRMKDEFEALLTDPNTSLPPGFTLEALNVEGSFPDITVTILVRDLARPECLFGYKYGAFWDEVESEAASREERMAADPASGPAYLWVSLREALLDIPQTCESGGITWIEEQIDGIGAAAERVQWTLWLPAWLPPGSHLDSVTYRPETPRRPEAVHIGYKHPLLNTQDTGVIESNRALLNLNEVDFDVYGRDETSVYVRRDNVIWRAWTVRGVTQIWFLTLLDKETVVRMADSLVPVAREG